MQIFFKYNIYMRKIYFNLMIALIFIIIFYYIFYYYTKKEAFTPSIRGVYRPYIRVLNQHYEYFTNNYGLQPIINKLRKWNIY
jgi:hypothetical protein